MIIVIRRVLIVALGVSLLFLVNRYLTSVDDPYAGFKKSAPGRLEERVALYAEGRLNDDWPAIYELVDPVQRQNIDLRRYLDFYGQGVLLIHGVEVLDTSIDYDTHTAITQLKLDGELNVAKLPAKFRNSLRIDDPAALRQPREVPVHWVWVEGDWYYKVESAINNGSVSGSQGDQEVTPLSELPE